MCVVCENCNSRNPAEAEFCHRCGLRLGARVEVIERKRWSFVLLVQHHDDEFRLAYDGRAPGFETVQVDGVEVVRRSGPEPMSHRYEFHVGHRHYTLSVTVPARAKSLVPQKGLN